MTNLNKKFTGGDNLEGFEKKLHDVLMQTELNDGYGAYQFLLYYFNSPYLRHSRQGGNLFSG